MANAVAEERLKRLLEQYREICLVQNPQDDSPPLNLITHNAGGSPHANGADDGNDDEDEKKQEEYTLDEWTTGVREHRNIV